MNKISASAIAAFCVLMPATLHAADMREHQENQEGRIVMSTNGEVSTALICRSITQSYDFKVPVYYGHGKHKKVKYVPGHDERLREACGLTAGGQYNFGDDKSYFIAVAMTTATELVTTEWWLKGQHGTYEESRSGVEGFEARFGKVFETRGWDLIPFVGFSLDGGNNILSHHTGTRAFLGMDIESGVSQSGWYGKAGFKATSGLDVDDSMQLDGNAELGLRFGDVSLGGKLLATYDSAPLLGDENTKAFVGGTSAISFGDNVEVRAEALINTEDTDERLATLGLSYKF